MADYQKMYYTLLHATEQAIETLIAAQQACEDIYIDSEESEEKPQE